MAVGEADGGRERVDPDREPDFDSDPDTDSEPDTGTVDLAESDVRNGCVDPDCDPDCDTDCDPEPDADADAQAETKSSSILRKMPPAITPPC
jgi:hypothetical protein